MPHANHAWVQTDYGYCAEASCLDVPAGAPPSAAIVLDPWDRPVAAAWNERRGPSGDLEGWSCVVVDPRGNLVEQLVIFND